MRIAGLARVVTDPLYCFPGCGGWVENSFRRLFDPTGEGSGQLAGDTKEGTTCHVPPSLLDFVLCRRSWLALPQYEGASGSEVFSHGWRVTRLGTNTVKQTIFSSVLYETVEGTGGRERSKRHGAG